MVKTAASHAVNIGSNPVRVTTQKQVPDPSLRPKGQSSLLSLLFRFRTANVALVCAAGGDGGSEKDLTGEGKDNIIQLFSGKAG